MFQIRELELMNWDFWDRISIPLDAQIVTIVGPNGSGKTTLLDALRTILALKCSGRRDYKRYVRNNRENFAWLRAEVSNPRRETGGLFPYLFFPATSETVTLFCRVRKQGGDWVRHYAIAEGSIALTPETENQVSWLGVQEYRRRLEQAGLTPAIAEVLALEQGDTDKLCEYSPKALLDLVFQVFGDKAVLDNYQEAKLRLKEAEAELGKMHTQLSQLGNDVEALKNRANRHLEWKQLKDEAVALESEILPSLQYADQIESLRGLLAQYRGLRRQRQEARASLRLAQHQISTRQSDVDAVITAERAAKGGYDEAIAQFQQARDAARDTDNLLREAEKLRQLAQEEHGADAIALHDKLGQLKAREQDIKQSLRQMRTQREEAATQQFALEQGRQPAPEFVRTMRAALDEAGIAHQVLTEILEVRDAHWQEAVEALMAPYRYIVLLKKESDRQQAWEIGQRLRYRHFIVSDAEPASAAQSGSLLEVVKFKDAAPPWLVRQLNQTQRVRNVQEGHKQSGDWITPDGFYKERRGARHIGVDTREFAFGEGARLSKLSDLSRSLKQINQQILEQETQLSLLTREITPLEQQLMGMQAVVQLASRQSEFDAAALRFPELQAAVQQAGEKLAEAQAGWEAERDRRESARILQKEIEIESARLHREYEAETLQLNRARADFRRANANRRKLRAKLPARWKTPESLKALRNEHGSEAEARHSLKRIEERLSQGDWETDDSVLLRRDKMLADYESLSRDAGDHQLDVNRTAELTDEARAAYINKLKATVRTYGRNVKRLGELAGIDVEIDTPHLENDDTVLSQAGLSVRFNFDQKGMMGMNDGEASGGQQVMKSLILLIGLMMDEANPSGFVFIDEPFAHLDIFNIDRVGGFLKATQAQYLITTPLTHNSNVYGPSELTLTTRKKRPGEVWAPKIMQTRRRVAASTN